MCTAKRSRFGIIQKFSPGLTTVWSSHLSWCSHIILDRTFRAALICDRLWSCLCWRFSLLILFLKSPNSVKRVFLSPHCIFFFPFSTVFGQIPPLGSPQLVSGGIAISMALSLFIWTWNQNFCLWGLLTSSGLRRWLFLFLCFSSFYLFQDIFFLGTVSTVLSVISPNLWLFGVIYTIHLFWFSYY